MAQAARSEETEVWARARTGERSAFGEVFDRHYDRVFRHSLGILGSVHDGGAAARHPHP